MVKQQTNYKNALNNDMKSVRSIGSDSTDQTSNIIKHQAIYVEMFKTQTHQKDRVASYLLELLRTIQKEFESTSFLDVNNVPMQLDI